MARNIKYCGTCEHNYKPEGVVPCCTLSLDILREYVCRKILSVEVWNSFDATDCQFWKEREEDQCVRCAHGTLCFDVGALFHHQVRCAVDGEKRMAFRHGWACPHNKFERVEV